MTRIPDGDLSMDAALERARRLPETFTGAGVALTPRQVIDTLTPVRSGLKP